LPAGIEREEEKARVKSGALNWETRRHSKRTTQKGVRSNPYRNQLSGFLSRRLVVHVGVTRTNSLSASSGIPSTSVVPSQALPLQEVWAYTDFMVRMRAKILALALVFAIGLGFVPDCFSQAAASSAAAMACCKSMPCNPANHARDCCRRISRRSVAFVLTSGPAPVRLMASQFSRIGPTILPHFSSGFERITNFPSPPPNQSSSAVISLRI